MAAPKNNFLANLVSIFNKLTLQQKALIGGIAVVSVLFLIFTMMFLNEPTYSQLYSNLSEEEANKVIQYLKEQKVQYKLEDNGKAIRVPQSQLYELRLALAGQGIPSSGMVGYEIFDKSTMGMSEFMQKLSFKRALEGEISRTISQQANIEAARVHIVMPAKSVFKEEQKDPTASVILKLKTGFNPPKETIMAISHLVASSVEGLKPNKVTIVDTKGKLLSDQNEQNSFGALSTKQYEMKNNVENYLAGKAQSLLDNVVGYGNSIVRVNVELNFDQVEKQLETYDPESQVIISEQTTKSESGGKSYSDSNLVINENRISNYEFTKSIQKVVEGTGNIKRLTIAAVVNGFRKEVKSGDDVSVVFEPRTEQQINSLTELVKQSVGFDVNRNDNVSVVNMNFETEQDMLDTPKTTPFGDFQDITKLVLIIAGLLGAGLVLKNLLSKLKNEKIIIGTVTSPEAAMEMGAGSLGSVIGGTEVSPKSPQLPKKRTPLQVGDIEDEISDEAINKKMMQDKIKNYVAQNPNEAAKLINLWLREDEY